MRELSHSDPFAALPPRMHEPIDEEDAVTGRLISMDELDGAGTIAAPMSKHDLESLTTLLYRAKGECYRRGLDERAVGCVSRMLGLSLALLSTADES